MRPVERVLERLEGVRESGEGWSALCPAHDDARASLSVSEGREERALLYCRAGCEQADILSALSPLGLDASDLFDSANGNGSKPPTRKRPKPEPAALPGPEQLKAAQTSLLSNELLLARVRELKAWSADQLEALGVGFDGERLTFPIHNAGGDLVNASRYKPGGNGTKMLALRGRPRDLFPAPETIDAELIFLVEGEPDAISGAELGLAAVSVPGVQGWRKGWAARFTGRRVVVCFDADAPGRQAAAKVDADLRAAGVDSSVLDFADDRTDGYDLGDLLLEAAEGGSAEIAQAGRTLVRAAAASARTHESAPRGAENSDENTEPPKTAHLLEAVAGMVRRFVVLSDEQRDVVALWVAHAHALDAADTTPYLSVSSAEKRSGKSRLMEVLAQLVPNPIEAANISEAALFRAIGSDPPSTLLFDEIDATFGPKARDKEDLRALVNAGYRRGARAYRCVGDGSNQRVEAFPVFGAKALSGIGELPETIADRSVPIRLRRRSRSEPVQRGRFRTIVDAGTPIREAAAKWALANVEELRVADPDLPEEIDDRAQDGAEPLLAIADLARGDWPHRARLALVSLHGENLDEGDSWGVQLLADVRDAFGDEDRIATAALLERLKADDEKPWAGWGEHGMNPRALARLLTPYGIRSRSIRLKDGTARGFKRDQFEDAFTRYIPQSGSESDTSDTTALQSQKPTVLEVTHEEPVSDRKALQTALQSQCVGVSDKTPYGGVGK